VEYLANNGYVPPNGKGWVDHIRKKGNEATHEIILMKREDALELMAFPPFTSFRLVSPTREWPNPALNRSAKQLRCLVPTARCAVVPGYLWRWAGMIDR
jgi:Domain of unknown function (DUF4145)